MLELRFFPDPIFKQKAIDVTVFDQDLLKLEQDFISALQYYDALGIGANMLGILQRVIIVSDGKIAPIFMINPIWKATKELKVKGEEASISIPGINLLIERFVEIEVQYQDVSGAVKVLKAENLLARVIQHETDYLDGITIFDHVSKTKRMIAIEKYHNLLKSKKKN